MSFILDALKKSESERQRQLGPGLVDSGIRARRRRLPAWAIIICMLLGINVVILAVMLLRQQTPAAPATAASPAPAPATVMAAPAPSPNHFSPLDTAPVYAPEIPVDQPEPGASINVPGPRTARQRAEPAAPDSGAQDDELLPEISQVTLAGGQSLPDLHLDVHVYATRPADRFVYINMRKYREGALLPEGLSIEHIRRDGVVLNYQGVRFLLPRQ
jgi:general secretion pathway protein B